MPEQEDDKAAVHPPTVEAPPEVNPAPPVDTPPEEPPADEPPAEEPVVAAKPIESVQVEPDHMRQTRERCELIKKRNEDRAKRFLK